MAFPSSTAIRIGGARCGQFVLDLFLLLCIFQTFVSCHPQLHKHQRRSTSASNAAELETTGGSDELQVCYNSDIS